MPMIEPIRSAASVSASVSTIGMALATEASNRSGPSRASWGPSAAINCLLAVITWYPDWSAVFM